MSADVLAPYVFWAGIGAAVVAGIWIIAWGAFLLFLEHQR